MGLAPSTNVIKLFTSVSYECSVQPSLIFEDKAKTYPRVEHLKGASLG
jgi:hypothetical protein